MDRFIRKFDPDVEMFATLAIAKGQYLDHGWALSITQEKRRCLLLDTTFGLTDDGALWTALSYWATFQPQ
jgi:hypothetical protein